MAARTKAEKTLDQLLKEKDAEALAKYKKCIEELGADGYRVLYWVRLRGDGSTAQGAEVVRAGK